MITNNEYLTEYIHTRGLSQKTQYTIKSVLNHYTTYQETNLYDLLLEADQEEEAGIRWKKRTLKKRLTSYMNHLRTTMDINSAKTYFSIIKTFYRHHEIEIGTLPNWNLRNSKTFEPITYADLPDKEIIRTAVEMSNPKMRSIILFLASTGMSKVDMRNISIKSFINSTSSYHNSNNISDVVAELLDYNKPIIPTWKLRRSKTNKYFITFNTPETTVEILKYLQYRLEQKNITPNDKLFPINEHYFTRKFEELNDAMQLGKIGAYNRFRGHMLRKFHSSQLSKAGMDRSKINVLQGKSNGKVDDVYFYEDEEALKNDYVQHMSELLIFTQVEKIDSPAVLEVKKENQILKSKLEDLEQLKSDVEHIKSWWKF